MYLVLGIVGALALAFGAVAVHDVNQRHHAILHNFPVVGHLRYILERFGPELRQYIVTGNDEERPFSRDQRTWVYASGKGENNMFGFGTDNELEQVENYLIVKHSAFPHPTNMYEGPLHALPCAKVMGEKRGRKKAFRPASVINTSAMSFGSLSGAAVEAINKGCRMAGAMQNTGEGGIANHHDHGGDLIWQIGTGYFGCRNKDGSFSIDMLKERVSRYNVKMLEIKLSQGAKPGKGGVLPGEKVTPEIAGIRGVEVGKTVVSPSYHTAFSSVDEMLDFVEMVADETGLPVGIKSAVGESGFWIDLAEQMEKGDRGVDYIQIDGGEGGTGAAPLVFADHVSLPFKLGFTRVYKEFAKRGIENDLLWIGSGKLGFPQNALLAMGMGCDMVAVAREAMLAIGCIQAQKCQTGHCPTGVATQNKWLAAGLDPELKSARLANYLGVFRHDLLALANACGQPHPALVGLERLEVLDGQFGSRTAREIFGYESGWGALADAQVADLLALSRANDAH